MLDIEWHYTVSDLCGLMARVDDLPLFSVSLDLTDPAAFAHVASKGFRILASSTRRWLSRPNVARIPAFQRRLTTRNAESTNRRWQSRTALSSQRLRITEDRGLSADTMLRRIFL